MSDDMNPPFTDTEQPPPLVPLTLTPIARLSRDLRKAATLLTPTEARFLVDGYYLIQENRIRADAQVRSMAEAGEPVTLLLWLGEQMRSLENQVKGGLDKYSMGHPVGEWARSVTGVGPVIAAGLLAHIDIKKAPTAGHIFSFAGLNAEREWLGSKRAGEVVREVVGKDKKGRLSDTEIADIATGAGFNVSFIMAMLKDDPPTVTKVIKAVSKRPWNAQLKTLCWKLGESFVKVSGNENDVYGKLYLQRKAKETAANKAGEYADQAKAMLAKKNFGKGTEAYKAYVEGRLPLGHIHARAKRWAVKIFLSNLHEVWYEKHHGVPAPAPYPFAHLGHVHKINPV